MINRPGKRTVDRRSHKRAGESGGPLMLNIRVRRLRLRESAVTTPDDVRDALQILLDTHAMPPGWQFMAVDWKNPHRFGRSWQTGWPSHATTDDEHEFLEAFTRAVQAKLHLAKVRKL